MNRSASRALAGALILLVGAAEGPRVVPLVRAWIASRSWPATRTAIVDAATRIGTSLNWSRPALIAGAVVIGLCLIGAVWLFRRQPRPQPAETIATPDRRGQVIRLSRLGNGVADISRETRLAQDAVRAMLAAR